MKINKIKLYLRIALVLLTASASIAQAKIIHSEKSLYRNIIVDDNGYTRCLKFKMKYKAGRKLASEQSCMNTKFPDHLVFPYARMIFSSLFINPNPRKILIVGLGGGSIPTTLRKLYPDSTIHVVEIDPAVLTVAKKYFQFKEDKKLKVTIQDARVYIKRAKLNMQRYNLIVLDAFNGDYIPEHLLTKEFLQETKAILSKNGLLAANTFTSSGLYDHESATYTEVFGTFIQVKKGNQGNRIILVAKKQLPNLQQIKQQAQELAPKLKPFGIKVNKLLNIIRTKPDWNRKAKVLTDQYSPANLLNLKQR